MAQSAPQTPKGRNHGTRRRPESLCDPRDRDAVPARLRQLEVNPKADRAGFARTILPLWRQAALVTGEHGHWPSHLLGKAMTPEAEEAARLALVIPNIPRTMLRPLKAWAMAQLLLDGDRDWYADACWLIDNMSEQTDA